MKLKNPFPQEVRLLFLYCYRCFECGRNGSTSGGMELHHIYGRGSASAYNAAPLCKECHNKIGHSVDEHRRILMQTVKWLAMQNYRPNEYDTVFLVHIRRDFDYCADKLLLV